MAFGIKIQKIKELNPLYFYEVSTYEPNKIVFYILINALTNRVIFFNESTFEHPLAEINFNNPDELLPTVPGIPIFISHKVAMRAYKALKSGDFAEHIGFST